jgi:hypothetical protein
MFIQVGKILIIIGILILAAGLGLYILGRLNIPLGRLPGDIQITRNNVTCLIPIATSILLSLLLTIGLNLLLRWLQK